MHTFPVSQARSVVMLVGLFLAAITIDGIASAQELPHFTCRKRPHCTDRTCLWVVDPIQLNAYYYCCTHGIGTFYACVHEPNAACPCIPLRPNALNFHLCLVCYRFDSDQCPDLSAPNSCERGKRTERSNIILCRYKKWWEW
jgi:hypothetical protein